MTLWQRIGEDYGSILASARSSWQEKEKTPRTAPIDLPIGEGNDGKLVRLDVVILAMHLAAAKYAFGKCATSVRDQLRKLQLVEEQIVLAKVVGSTKAAVGKAGARMATMANALLNFLDADLLELSKEIAVRRLCWQARRDVYQMGLSQTKHRTRKTKLVASRNRTPKQRKANKSWRSPR